MEYSGPGPARFQVSRKWIIALTAISGMSVAAVLIGCTLVSGCLYTANLPFYVGVNCQKSTHTSYKCEITQANHETPWERVSVIVFAPGSGGTGAPIGIWRAPIRYDAAGIAAVSGPAAPLNPASRLVDAGSPGFGVGDHAVLETSIPGDLAGSEFRVEDLTPKSPPPLIRCGCAPREDRAWGSATIS